MSLKAFHVLFVSVCILLTLMVMGWSIREYMNVGGAGNLVLAAVAFVAGVLLTAYSRWFVHKLKGVSYL